MLRSRHPPHFGNYLVAKHFTNTSSGGGGGSLTLARHHQNDGRLYEGAAVPATAVPRSLRREKTASDELGTLLI